MVLACLRDVDQQSELLETSSSENNGKKLKAIYRIQKALITAQELGDEKLNVVQNLLDLIENKTRQLDLDLKNLGTIPNIKRFIFILFVMFFRLWKRRTCG